MNAISKTQEQESFDEYKAIEKTLQPYIDAAKTGNGSAMRSIWFDHAHIVGSLDGNAVNVDANAFCNWIDQVGGSAEVEARIVSIDYVGNAGAAKIEFVNWGGAPVTLISLYFTNKMVSGKSVVKSMIHILETNLG